MDTKLGWILRCISKIYHRNWPLRYIRRRSIPFILNYFIKSIIGSWSYCEWISTLPGRHLISVSVAVVIIHFTPPMVTSFLSVPAKQPVHEMVTSWLDSPPFPLAGVIELIVGVRASEYSKEQSPLQTLTISLIERTTWNWNHSAV